MSVMLFRSRRSLSMAGIHARSPWTTPGFGVMHVRAVPACSATAMGGPGYGWPWMEPDRMDSPGNGTHNYYPARNKYCPHRPRHSATSRSLPDLSIFKKTEGSNI